MKVNIKRNRLESESSPYLLQHSENPVDWYPWGTDAFDRARSENRLVIISIGYSACHWCHVMEHETFSDEDVAALMNAHFVAVKVDREERPDVDQVYMSAVQALTGSGGWPLNVITLPDGKPVFGGTYFRKEKWIEILKQLQQYYTEFPEKTALHAARVTAEAVVSDNLPAPGAEMHFTNSDLVMVVKSWLGMTDSLNGGYRGAPKFALPAGYSFLLSYWQHTGAEDALNACTLTLKMMEKGGIHDHAGGGFARYATDEKWRIPHFEKMLYDNAQLLSLYSLAYQATGEKSFAHTAHKTAGFMARELRDSDGLFWSSIDADSEGTEGKFYTWTYEEFSDIAGENAGIAAKYFGVTKDGNWEEGRNIIYLENAAETVALESGITPSQLENIISETLNNLLAAREHRIRPATDTKKIASWNALAVKGFADAYLVFRKEEYLDLAVKTAEGIIGNPQNMNNSLSRLLGSDAGKIEGFLDDYAFAAMAFISLYVCTFDEKWINAAENLCTFAIANFSDEESPLLYYSNGNDPLLIARKHEVTDNVIPSSNSVMAWNLVMLGRYLGNEEYLTRAQKMLKSVRSDALTGGPYYAVWDSAAALLVFPETEIIVTGKEWKSKMEELSNYYLPGVLFAGGSSEGRIPLLKNRISAEKTYLYLCKDRTCSLPSESVSTLIEEAGIYRKKRTK